MTIIDRETFLKLPADDIATLVRSVGPQVCVFPMNGTRRWFMLEYSTKLENNWLDSYINACVEKQIEINGLLFEHGLETLVLPMFGSELFSRGEAYAQKAIADGLSTLATHPDFLAFYEKLGVRVRFYGDYRRQFSGTPYAHLCDLFDDITRRTLKNDHYRIFYGVFGTDATESVASLSIDYFQQTGKIPNRNKLVEMYYGEYIQPANLFIGCNKFNVFDYPLLSLGEEDLYFMVTPSQYLDAQQLRTILYDHVCLRSETEIDYTEMNSHDFAIMQKFYQENKGKVFGTGIVNGGIWYPSL